LTRPAATGTHAAPCLPQSDFGEPYRTRRDASRTQAFLCNCFQTGTIPSCSERSSFSCRLIIFGLRGDVPLDNRDELILEGTQVHKAGSQVQGLDSASREGLHLLPNAVRGHRARFVRNQYLTTTTARKRLMFIPWPKNRSLG
jgi:hypothetical protein